MKKVNYLLCKDKVNKESMFIEYSKIEGYKITPKTKKEDAIDVNKIIFISPDFSEKLIRKKIDIKIKQLLKYLKDLDDDSDDSEGVRKSLIEAEKLKVKIIEMYVKYLGNTYERLTLKKIQIIINQLKYKLINIETKDKLKYTIFDELEEPKSKKSR